MENEKYMTYRGLPAPAVILSLRSVEIFRICLHPGSADRSRHRSTDRSAVKPPDHKQTCCQRQEKLGKADKDRAPYCEQPCAQEAAFCGEYLNTSFIIRIVSAHRMSPFFFPAVVCLWFKRQSVSIKRPSVSVS